jgi:hypothetical protein
MCESKLRELLALLDVGRVLVIDDDFTPPASVYTLTFEAGSGPTVQGLPELPQDADYEDHVQRHWPQVAAEEKLEIRRQARLLPGFQDQTGDPTGLQGLLENGMYFRGMTLLEWTRESTQLLANQQRALILFDVNFQQETHDAEGEEGLGPAGEALNATHNHIVGLLTTKVQAGEEESQAEAWAPRAHVGRADLVVVNKNLLIDPENHEAIASVAEQIRETLQASQLGRVRETVRAALESALRETDERISASSPTVLEDLVFRCSRDGGEWEGDTWFRLFSTLGLAAARREVAVDKSTRRAIEDVRNLVHSGPGGAHEGSAVLAAEVERAEAYSDEQYVNGAGLPIENGDIFKSKDGRTFILIGQPCDLVLRPEGRAKDPESATLLLIRERNADGGGDQSSAFALPPGAPLAEGEWEVRFRPEYHVAFDVLDLVSFNTAGRANLKPAKGTALSPLLPGLSARLAAIKETARASAVLLESIDGLVGNDQIAEPLGKALRHRILDAGGPFKATLGAAPTPFAFDCRRVGRLAGSYADALLAAHSAARSRTAHAHELTRIVAEEGSP